MAETPYLVVNNFVLGASGSGSWLYQVNTGEKMRFKDFVFVSTGAFSIVGIRDSDGTPYSNANAANPILSTMIQDARNAFRSNDGFLEGLEIEGNKTFYIDLLDTSAAPNTVRIVFKAVRIKP